MNTRHVCVRCRWTWLYNPICTKCGVRGQEVEPKWRAPKKSNDLAWKRIAKGDWLWDHDAVAKAATIRTERIAVIRDAMIRRARLRRR